MSAFSRFALILLVAAAPALHAQRAPRWIPQQTGTTAEFRALSVVGGTVIWAGGRGGVFARSVDGGATWRSDTVPGASGLFFTGVHAVDANTAYFLGTNFDGGAAKIFKTTDGGRRWLEQYSIARQRVFFDGIAFWDATHGIAFSDPVSGAFLIVTTSDGGKSWKGVPRDRIPPPLTGEAAFAASGRAIVVRGPSTVWFATGGGAQARVFRSTDRGRTWTVASTPLPASATAGIFGLAFVDENIGFAVGGDYAKPTAASDNVLRTNDGGRTWATVGRALPAGVRYGVSAVRAAGGISLVAVGPSGPGFSGDGGKTWTAIDTVSLNTVSLVDRNNGWAAGVAGRILKLAPSPSRR